VLISPIPGDPQQHSNYTYIRGIKVAGPERRSPRRFQHSHFHGYLAGSFSALGPVLSPGFYQVVADISAIGGSNQQCDQSCDREPAVAWVVVLAGTRHSKDGNAAVDYRRNKRYSPPLLPLRGIPRLGQMRIRNWERCLLYNYAIHFAQGAANICVTISIPAISKPIMKRSGQPDVFRGYRRWSTAIPPVLKFAAARK